MNLNLSQRFVVQTFFLVSIFLFGCESDEPQLLLQIDLGQTDVGVGDTHASSDQSFDAQADLSDEDTDVGRGPFELSVSWETCSLFSEGNDSRAECASVEVPLFWEDRDGVRIEVFLKRHVGTGDGQVWVLPGGPGQPGSDLEPFVNQLITLDGEKTYYLIDHRGVGRSTRLSCESSEGLVGPNGMGLGEGEIEACLEEVRQEWSDAELGGFSSTEAARDVGELIALLRKNDEDVSLWGGSYGTIWLERYLNLYTNQPTSVIFSAIAIDVDMLSLDRNVDEVTRRWNEACDANQTCGGQFQAAFGRSAAEVAVDTFSGVGKRLCDEIEALGIDIPTLKPFFGQIFSDRQGRALYSPIMYRIARCAPEDVTAIENLVAALTPPDGMPPEPTFGIRNWGFVLGENISVSELSSERTAEQVTADYEAAVAVQGNTPRLAESRAIWPRYEAEPITNSDYQGLLLLLHGEFDFLPKSAYRGTVDHYLANNPNATFIEIPGAPHSLESPMLFGGQCGASLIVSRLLNPSLDIDDCSGDVVALLFAPSGGVSTTLFGTEDPWDGIP